MKPPIAIPKNAIKINLPNGRQQTDYSCGASAFRIVCKHYMVWPATEREYMDLLNTTYRCGTDAEMMATEAKNFGFNVDFRIGMSMRRIKDHLRARHPVICSIQAWGDPRAYKEALSGHYVIANGFDDKNMYFEDPSLDSGYRGYIGHKEFKERWHDIDCGDEDCYYLGIAIWADWTGRGKRIKWAKKIE